MNLFYKHKIYHINSVWGLVRLLMIKNNGFKIRVIEHKICKEKAAQAHFYFKLSILTNFKKLVFGRFCACSRILYTTAFLQNTSG